MAQVKPPAFYMIVGLVPMDKGRILLDDEDISFSLLPYRRPTIFISLKRPIFCIARYNRALYTFR
jgi:ABC-type lipopolysaccharide export system ATPase subunit